MNANRRHACPLITRLLMHPFPFNKIKKAVKELFGIYDTKVMAWCYQQLLENASRDQIPDDLRQEIAALFAEDQAKLKRLLAPAGVIGAA